MTAPANILSAALALLRATLADCATFRGLTAPAMDQAAALGRIYYEGLPLPAGDHYTLTELAGYRPYALCYHAPERGFRARAAATSPDRYDWNVQGRLVLSIEKNAAAANVAHHVPTPEAELVWRNEVGGIVDDLLGLAGRPGYLNIVEIGTLLGPYSVGENDAAQEGPWQVVHLEIVYEGAA